MTAPPEWFTLPSWDREKAGACRGKVRWARLKQARAKLAEHQKNGRDLSMNIYQCRFCHAFHLGHKLDKPTDRPSL